MNDETYEALKTIMYHVRSYTKELHAIDEEMGQVEGWIDETAKEHPEEDQS